MSSTVPPASSWFWATESSSSRGLAGAEGVSVAIDANNNTYLTGYLSNDTITIGSFTLEASQYNDEAFLIKYDANGNVLWAKQSHGDSSSETFGSCVTTDILGNVYVAGGFGVFNNSVSFDTFRLNGTSFETMFLVKYDINGNVIWAKQSSTPNVNSACVARSVTTDKIGNIYVTGFFQDSVYFGSMVLSANINSFFTAKYNADGNPIWVSQPKINSQSLEEYESISIATDKFKNIYVTGLFSDTIIMGPDTLLNRPKAINSFIAKYDSNGNVLWAKQSNSLREGQFVTPSAVTTDNDGNSYLTGSFSDSLVFGNVRLIFPSSRTGYNIYLIKVDSSGRAIWGKFSKCSLNSAYSGYAVATDTQNNVYLSAGGEIIYGAQEPDTVLFDSDTLVVNNKSTDGNSILLKLDSSGNTLCSTIIAGGGDDVNGIAVSPSGDYIYFGGDMYTAIKLGLDSLPDEYIECPFMARWNPCCLINGKDSVSVNSPAVCNGSSAILIATGAQFYSWLPNNSLNIISGDSVVANATTTTTYTVIGTNNGCFFDTAQSIVTVNPSPLLIINPPSPTICRNTGINITATGANIYQWFPSIGLSATSGSSILANPTITTTYTLRGFRGSCLDSMSFTVMVTQLSVNSPTVCSGDSATLIANGVQNYNWSPINNLNKTTGDSVIANPSSTTTYTVIGTDNGCSDTAQSIVTIESIPNKPTIIRSGYVLISSATQGNQWEDNGNIINGATDQNYTVTKTGCYSVNVINPANGCSSTSDTTCIDTSSGVKQFMGIGNLLSIHPNPTEGKISIIINSSITDLKDWNLEINNVFEQLVYTKSSLNHNNDIDLSNLPSGVYFITMLYKTARTILPVIKE